MVSDQHDLHLRPSGSHYFSLTVGKTQTKPPGGHLQIYTFFQIQKYSFPSILPQELNYLSILFFSFPKTFFLIASARKSIFFSFKEIKWIF
jgi:hypothetical protein